MTRIARASAWQVLRIPAGLAALSAAGLTASLVGDGGWDASGAALLLVPAAVALAKLAPLRRLSGRRSAAHAMRLRSQY